MRAMPVPNRLGVVATLIAIGLFASSMLALPARDVGLDGLSVTLSGNTLLGFVLVGLAWTGTDAIMRDRPQIREKPVDLLILPCILPAALTAAAWALLAQPDTIGTKIVGTAGSAGLLAILILLEYHAMDAKGRWRVAMQFAQHTMSYLTATLLYLAIRLSMSTNLTATLAVVSGSAVLGWRLLADEERRLWVLGLALLLGLTSWLFGLWVSSPLAHSLVLVVFLYVGAGITRHFHVGELTQRLALEYLIVALVVLVLLLSWAR
ncbi:MAG: hypothetical protein AMJ93_04465 [Anaerolineae bacterium SM23_84]|nr:MAG: hypothetical protein AMJ93_04465 [Anaerolineae bacterium SM23_84]